MGFADGAGTQAERGPWALHAVASAVMAALATGCPSFSSTPAADTSGGTATTGDPNPPTTSASSGAPTTQAPDSGTTNTVDDAGPTGTTATDATTGPGDASSTSTGTTGSDTSSSSSGASSSGSGSSSTGTSSGGSDSTSGSSSGGSSTGMTTTGGTTDSGSGSDSGSDSGSGSSSTGNAGTPCDGGSPLMMSVLANNPINYMIDLVNDPPLTVVRGCTYTFAVAAPGHPFWIKTVQSTGTDNAYDEGIAGNGTSMGNLVWTVADTAPDTLFYNCELHAQMTNTITVIDPTP